MSSGPVKRAEESAEPTATLAEVDIRSELSTRRPRLPDSEGLDRALAVLAREMTEDPRSMLQRLVETARELCRADTAGISLLEADILQALLFAEPASGRQALGGDVDADRAPGDSGFGGLPGGEPGTAADVEHVVIGADLRRRPQSLLIAPQLGVIVERLNHINEQ